MTAAQIQKLYPGNQVARIAASALADDRKAERRAEMPIALTRPYGAGLRTESMPEHRTRFEQEWMAHQKRKTPYLLTTDTTYTVRGRFTDDGEWVYDYFNVQCGWDGYIVALRTQGVVLV